MRKHALYISPGASAPVVALIIAHDPTTGLADLAIVDQVAGSTILIDNVPRGALEAAPCIADLIDVETFPALGVIFPDVSGDNPIPVVLTARDQSDGSYSGVRLDFTPFTGIASPGPAPGLIDPVKGCWIPSPTKT